MSEAFLFAFLGVFLRCSAMMLASPVFGAQTTPVIVRVLTTFSLSAALTTVIHPQPGPVPVDFYLFVASLVQEVLAGLLIGTFMTLALQVAQMAGSIMDLNIGLSMSQQMNPINGVSVTIVSQLKYLLGLVIYLTIDAHHMAIQALVNSYRAVPSLTWSSVPAIQHGVVQMFGAVFLIAVQIAAPVMGVSLVVDGALGLINRAVPQMQALQVGMPAKIGLGLTAVGVALPALVAGVSSAVHLALQNLMPIFHM